MGGGGDGASDGHSEGEEEKKVVGGGDGAEEDGVESGDLGAGAGEEESEGEIAEDGEDHELGGGAPSVALLPLEVRHCWVANEVTSEEFHRVGSHAAVGKRSSGG